jgi:methyltransferase-like protein
MSGLRARAQETRRLLDFMVEATQSLDGQLATTLDMNAYALMLQRERELINGRPDLYIAHEFLEEFNDPIYFNEFIEWAGQHGLQYLAEAEYSTMHTANFPAEVADKIRGLGHGLIETEQYMDFLRNRTFRQTLLCHREVRLERELTTHTMASFRISSNVVPLDGQPDLTSQETDRYRGKNGTVLTVTNPICKAAMLHLGEIWPRAVTLEQLLDAARLRMEPDGSSVLGATLLDQQRHAVGDMLLRCLSLDIAEFHVAPPAYQAESGEVPHARELARQQARRSKSVTNLRHEQVVLDDEVSYYVLLNLDGSHDKVALVEMLAQLVANGTLVARRDGENLSDSDDLYEYLVDALNRSLTRLARAALLVN